MNSIEIGAVYYHKKSQGYYTVIGELRDQVLYVSHSTRYGWYRPKSEFMDGRFAFKPDAIPLYVEEIHELFNRG